MTAASWLLEICISRYSSDLGTVDGPLSRELVFHLDFHYRRGLQLRQSDELQRNTGSDGRRKLFGKLFAFFRLDFSSPKN
jgi:hypothetical protein